MNPDFQMPMNRRALLQRSATGLGATALASLLSRDAVAGTSPTLPHLAARAKRVIWLFQSGAPSQMDLFDYKPRLTEFHKQELPDSIRMGQRLTGMTSGQKNFPIAASKFKFAQHGQSSQ